ncbi:MAG: hypothetical protein ACOZNI_18380 [Myxococcota bacterium]
MIGALPASDVWLPSWTRTLNESEAFTLLDLALPGTSVAEWAARGHDRLPQASLPRRRELVRIVREELLDVADGTVIESAFGTLFREGSAHRRRGLLYGRLLAQRPLVEPAIRALVRPALLRGEAPLSPPDSDRIEPAEWDQWLRSVLKPDIGDEAFKKTRSTLQSALADAGCLDVRGNTSRTTRARRGEPDPLAFAWTLGAELARRGGEGDEGWATRESFAALLFAPRAEYAASAIDEGVAHGLLRRSYLAASPRLLVGAL